MEAVSATGDIWSTGAFSFESPLKDLLDSGEYSLSQLLEQDELLQELRGMHPQLVEFFSTPEAVVGLVKNAMRLDAENVSVQQNSSIVIMNGNHKQETTTTTTTEKEETVEETKESPKEEDKEEEKQETPQENDQEEKKPGQWLFPPLENPSQEKTPEELEELQTIRYPYMACEVICCEINSIIDILVDGKVNEKEPDHVQSCEKSDAVEVTTGTRDFSILDLLFSILSETPVGEMDDFRAGYFDKILSVLFRKRPKAMSAYINQGGISLLGKMMKHLYSHSIMQIVQRLLMPPPSSFLSSTDDEEQDDSGEYEDDNLNALFSCQWSEMPEAITLLLDSLIIDNDNGNDDEELLLRKSQSASEVLITVIQNSPLTSATLLALTTEPVMGRIISAACTLADGADFSPHDSSLTCAMNVLESIVLQLGGYGSVGTAVETGDDDETGQVEGPIVNGDDETIELEVNKIPKPTQEVATADALIARLPELLQALCGLLRHSSTETWQSPMQFAKTEKQQLLGMSRLRIVRLVESLVLLGNAQVDSLLCESECLSICLDLFWEFQWCSMLHQSVANLLVHVFEGANDRAQLQEYFLVKCNLLGRLMDSFQDPDEETEVEEGGDLLSNAVLAIQRLHFKTRSYSVQSERGSSLGSIDAAFGDNDDDDVIPVSDDDVDAALEQQAAVSEMQETEAAGDKEEAGTDATERESTNEVVDTENDVNQGDAEVKSSIPSLRMGCLGHVIIICQALVHACNADANESQEEVNDESQLDEEVNESTLMRSIDLGESAPDSGSEERQSDAGENDDASSEPKSDETSESSEPVREQGSSDQGESISQVETSDSQGSASNDLIIAQLVKTHPLHAEWNDFITTTLATETAIQSTPLGGTNVATVESIQGQLPVARSERTYDFGSDDAEDTGISARGFLGGEVLDMDDNDLDIAASMMEALNLSRPRSPNETGDDEADGRPGGVSNSFGTVVQNSGTGTGDYLFDDPLGGNTGFGGFGAQDDDSSDEEEEPVEGVPGGEETKDEDDAPVMDLFTGNFDGKDDTAGTSDQAVIENGGFSDFANFDDAFAAASANEGPIFNAGGSSDEDDVLKSASFENPLTVEESVEDLFGSTPPHALLLGDEDVNKETSPIETPAETASESANDAKADAGVEEEDSATDQSAESPPLAIPEDESPAEVSSTEVVSAEPKLETAISG